MRFLLSLVACATLAACDASEIPDAELTSPGQWMLVTPPATDLAHLDISFRADGTFGASGSCNGYGGTYAVDGNRVDIDVEGGTRKDCGEVGNEIEAAFVRGLEAANTFEIDGQTLSLDGRGVAFTFHLRFGYTVQPGG